MDLNKLALMIATMLFELMKPFLEGLESDGSSSGGVTKQDILDFCEENEIENGDHEAKKLLKTHGFKSIKHIADDYEDLAEILSDLKGMFEEDDKSDDDDDDDSEPKEIDMDDIEVGMAVILVDDEEEVLAEGEIEKLTKSAITIDGEKIKKKDVETVFTPADDDGDDNGTDEEVTTEMVQKALQAYKKEFGNKEYKAILKEYDIKSEKDLKDLDEDDLAKIYSEIVE